MFSGREGLSSLLKEGSKQYSGVNEVIIKNIEATRALSSMTETSLGPNGMNKLLVNHLDKQMVTCNASTITSELEVQHPAAKLLVMASKMQEAEFGDATNFVIVFGGELLGHAEHLIKEGIHVSEILRGYEQAYEKSMEYIKELSCRTVANILDPNEIATAIKSTISSNQLSVSSTVLAKLIAEAALQTMPSNPQDFNVDNIKVSKIPGGTLDDSYTIQGCVVSGEPVGTVKQKTDAKAIVLNCGLEMITTESKGTVLFKSAEEMLRFSKGEEEHVSKMIESIKNAGVDVIVANGAVSDLAKHFCDYFGILVLKITSKFETRRLCKALGAVAMVRLGPPTPEEAGFAESVALDVVGSKKITVVKGKGSRISTILLRGSTSNFLDEAERAIEDGVNCIKAIIKSGRLVAGAGATEIELSCQIQTHGAKVSGLEQYAIKKFGESLECVPRILATNAGKNYMDVITTLYAAHQKGKKYEGVNIEGTDLTLDAQKAEIYDHLETKKWALSLAFDAVSTILRLDHIIVARPAGGPNPRGGPGPDDD